MHILLILVENTSGNNDDDDDDDISDSELDRLINEVDNNVACDNKSGEISSTQNELSDSNISKLGQAANTFCNVKDALLLGLFIKHLCISNMLILLSMFLYLIKLLTNYVSFTFIV